MADWGYSFPVDVLAICLIQYSGDVRGSWTRGMAYTALTIATGLGMLLRSDALHSLCQFCNSGCSVLSPCSVLRNVRQWEQDLQIWKIDVQLIWHHRKWQFGSVCAATITAFAWYTALLHWHLYLRGGGFICCTSGLYGCRTDSLAPIITHNGWQKCSSFCSILNTKCFKTLNLSTLSHWWYVLLQQL